MKNAKKLLVIILVLLAPISVFLFLKGFGSNEFEVPIYYTDGNPISECNGEGKEHFFPNEILIENDIKLPILIYFADSLTNKFYSDLATVLEKYPNIYLLELALNMDDDIETSGETLNLDSHDYLSFINCQLVLGEDKFLSKAIANKYVLVDEERRIRGYYQVTNLDEIERLDVELDILLNY